MVLAGFMLVALTGCSGSAESTGRRSVVAAFYPLAWATQAVGGRSVAVRNLTPPGSEPHDVELTAREVGRIQHADVVLYLSHGFQPAVEHAVDDARGSVVDALADVRLRTDAGETDPHV